MPIFPDKPRTKDLQKYIDDMVKERGWEDQSCERKFLLFAEEVGELAKAIRNAEGISEEVSKGKKFELEEEFADVFSYLMDLANHFDVDLENALREKEKINANREWK